MKIERYSHVMHIVSTVKAKLAAGKSSLDALIASFPAGTLSGAPKPRAMQLIDELEVEFGVSRVTVSKAIELLEEEKLLKRQQCKGTFVLSNSN